MTNALQAKGIQKIAFVQEYDFKLFSVLTDADSFSVRDEPFSSIVVTFRIGTQVSGQVSCVFSKSVW